jgi:hypothetical protein
MKLPGFLNASLTGGSALVLVALPATATLAEVIARENEIAGRLQ